MSYPEAPRQSPGKHLSTQMGFTLCPGVSGCGCRRPLGEENSWAEDVSQGKQRLHSPDVPVQGVSAKALWLLSAVKIAPRGEEQQIPGAASAVSLLQSGGLGSQPQSLHGSPHPETNRMLCVPQGNSAVLVFLPKPGATLYTASPLCIAPCSSPENVPFLHSYTPLSNPCSWLGGSSPGCPQFLPHAPLGSLAQASLSQQRLLRSQRELCSHLVPVSLQVIFPFLLIFQSQESYPQAQAPHHIGSRNTKQEELWDHLSITPTSPFSRKEKKKLVK